ncbi:ribosomal RNA processing Brix domain protein [Actinidia rufa]|uniref:Ribosomal RNA processing Brix domain protein n=1 Tax=Actinidia rufa TaxID=165716 RepID=A0A7J0FUU1_9ERIC|nr:ribosomal RNA processing Brix domain protein [Actinidia rufa]
MPSDFTSKPMAIISEFFSLEYLKRLWCGPPTETIPPVPSNATLAFTEGMIVLQQPPGQNTNITDVPQSASAASMLDSGNFVLYNFDQEIIWQSFDHPIDTIVPGQHLTSGKELFSGASETDPSTGIFHLKMQNARHLVQYPVGTPDTAPYAY